MSANLIWENRRVLSVLALGVILVLFAFNTYFLFRPSTPKTPEMTTQEPQTILQPQVQEERKQEPQAPTTEKKLVQEAPSSFQPAYLAYVLNQKENTVAVLDLAQKKLIDKIYTGQKPSDAVIEGDRIYTLDTLSSSVSIIDLKQREVIGTIDTSPLPESLAVYRNSLFVTDNKDDAVRVYDLASRKETKIPVGKHPRFIALDKERAFLLVANFESNDVSIINANVKLSLDDVDVSGKGPASVAVSPLKDYMYIVNEQTNDVSVVSYRLTKKLQKESARIPVGLRPLRVAFTPDGAYALVTNYYSDSVSIISAQQQKVIKTIDVGSSPIGITVDDDSRYAYTADFNSNTISVIDLKEFKKIDSIPTGIGPVAVLLHERNR